MTLPTFALLIIIQPLMVGEPVRIRSAGLYAGLDACLRDRELVVERVRKEWPQFPSSYATCQPVFTRAKGEPV